LLARQINFLSSQFAPSSHAIRAHKPQIPLE
jgi:hypothetical protein